MQYISLDIWGCKFQSIAFYKVCKRTELKITFFEKLQGCNVMKLCTDVSRACNHHSRHKNLIHTT